MSVNDCIKCIEYAYMMENAWIWTNEKGKKNQCMQKARFVTFQIKLIFVFISISFTASLHIASPSRAHIYHLSLSLSSSHATSCTSHPHWLYLTLLHPPHPPPVWGAPRVPARPLRVRVSPPSPSPGAQWGTGADAGWSDFAREASGERKEVRLDGWIDGWWSRSNKLG